MENQVNVKRYVVKFSWMFALCSFLLLIFLAFVNTTNVAFSIMPILAAGAGTISAFIENEKRAPLKAEKSRLVWQCVGVSVAMQTILALLLTVPLSLSGQLGEIIQSIGFSGVALAAAVSLVLTAIVGYLLLSLQFGWQAKKMLAKREAKGWA